jgi:hypothetical protein
VTPITPGHPSAVEPKYTRWPARAESKHSWKPPIECRRGSEFAPSSVLRRISCAFSRVSTSERAISEKAQKDPEGPASQRRIAPECGLSLRRKLLLKGLLVVGGHAHSISGRRRRRRELGAGEPSWLVTAASRTP